MSRRYTFDDSKKLMKSLNRILKKGASKNTFESLWARLDTEIQTDIVKDAVNYVHEKISEWPYSFCTPPYPKKIDGDADGYWNDEAIHKLRWKLVKQFTPWYIGGIGLITMQFLSTAMVRTRLEGLRFYGNTFSKEGFKCLLEYPQPQLRYLSVAGSKLSSAQLSQLLKKMATDGHLERLALNENRLSNTNIKHLTTLDHLQQLKILHMYNTGLKDEHLKMLSSLPQLEELSLGDTYSHRNKTKITAVGLKAIVDGLPHLRELNLSRIKLDAAMEAVLKDFTCTESQYIRNHPKTIV